MQHLQRLHLQDDAHGALRRINRRIGSLHSVRVEFQRLVGSSHLHRFQIRSLSLKQLVAEDVVPPPFLSPFHRRTHPSTMMPSLRSRKSHLQQLVDNPQPGFSPEGRLLVTPVPPRVINRLVNSPSRRLGSLSSDSSQTRRRRIRAPLPDPLRASPRRLRHLQHPVQLLRRRSLSRGLKMHLQDATFRQQAAQHSRDADPTSQP